MPHFAKRLTTKGALTLSETRRPTRRSYRAEWRGEVCDAREALRRVRVPILCLVPKHDRLIPRSAVREIQRHAPGAQIAELAAPHCLLQCVFAAAALRIEEFMSRLS